MSSDAPKLLTPGSQGVYVPSTGTPLGQFVQQHMRIIAGAWVVVRAREYNEGAVQENNLPENTRQFAAYEVGCEGMQYLTIANLGEFTEDDPAHSETGIEGGRLHIYPDGDGFSFGATSGRDTPQIVLEVGETYSGPLQADVLNLRARQPTAVKYVCLGLPYGLR